MGACAVPSIKLNHTGNAKACSVIGHARRRAAHTWSFACDFAPTCQFLHEWYIGNDSPIIPVRSCSSGTSRQSWQISFGSKLIKGWCCVVPLILKQAKLLIMLSADFTFCVCFMVLPDKVISPEENDAYLTNLTHILGSCLASLSDWCILRFYTEPASIITLNLPQATYVLSKQQTWPPQSFLKHTCAHLSGRKGFPHSTDFAPQGWRKNIVSLFFLITNHHREKQCNF